MNGAQLEIVQLNRVLEEELRSSGQQLPRERSEFEWLYFQNPAAKQSGFATFLCAMKGAKLLGHLGFLLSDLEIRGDRVPSQHLMDLRVLPECRGAGVGRALLSAAIERVDLTLLLGMTPAAERLYRHLGFTQCGMLIPSYTVLAAGGLRAELAARNKPEWRLLASILEFGMRLRRSGAARSHSSDAYQITVGLPNGDGPILGTRGEGATVRSLWTADFWKWRFEARPGVQYQGYTCSQGGMAKAFLVIKAWRNQDGVLGCSIVDLVVESGERDAAIYLLVSVIARMKRAGVAYVKFAFSHRSADSIGRAAGALKIPGAIAKRVGAGSALMVAGPLAGRVESSIAEWWLSRADGEVDLNDLPTGVQAVEDWDPDESG